MAWSTIQYVPGTPLDRFASYLEQLAEGLGYNAESVKSKLVEYLPHHVRMFIRHEYGVAEIIKEVERVMAQSGPGYTQPTQSYTPQLKDIHSQLRDIPSQPRGITSLATQVIVNNLRIHIKTLLMYKHCRKPPHNPPHTPCPMDNPTHTKIYIIRDIRISW